MQYDLKDLKDENPKYCYKDKFSDVDWHDILTLTTALRSKRFEIWKSNYCHKDQIFFYRFEKCYLLVQKSKY